MNVNRDQQIVLESVRIEQLLKNEGLGKLRRRRLTTLQSYAGERRATEESEVREFGLSIVGDNDRARKDTESDDET